MSWASLLAGIVSLFNRLAQISRDNALKKNGANAAELKKRDELDDVRKEAEAIRRRSRPASKSDVIKRL